MRVQIPSFALTDVLSVEFYKRDEITTDIVCCEITIATDSGEMTFLIHEELPEFDALVSTFEALPGFDRRWREKVILPPFEEQCTVAYTRNAHIPTGR